jgi:GT2 family glycosyltransferase
MSHPRVSIIILSWNTRSDTLACLSSLKGSLGSYPAEIIVLDNGSQDGSADAIAEAHPDVVLERSPINLGFAKGVNAGLRRASGHYAALLNSDTLVNAGAVQELVSYLDDHGDVGVAGGKHLDNDGQHVPSAYRFPTLLHDLSHASGWHQLAQRHPVLRPYGRATGLVDWLSGSFLVMRREVIEQAGPMPEEFFVYGEDVEWFWRVREAGWKAAYVDGAGVRHLESRSAVQLFGAAKSLRILDGLHTFARRHRSAIGWRLGWAARAGFWGLLSARWELVSRLGSDERAAGRSRLLGSYAWRHVEHLLGRVTPHGVAGAKEAA